MITDLLGTPTEHELKFACEGARLHILRRPPKPAQVTMLYTLSTQATHEAVHLLTQMLVFNAVSYTRCLRPITVVSNVFPPRRQTCKSKHMGIFGILLEVRLAPPCVRIFSK